MVDLLFCLSSCSCDSCFSFTSWSSSDWACFNSESIFATDSASEYCRVLNWLQWITNPNFITKIWDNVSKNKNNSSHILSQKKSHQMTHQISNPSFQVLFFLLSMLLTCSHFPVLDFASVKQFHPEIRIDLQLQQSNWLQLHPEYFILNDTLKALKLMKPSW